MKFSDLMKFQPQYDSPSPQTTAPAEAILSGNARNLTDWGCVMQDDSCGTIPGEALWQRGEKEIQLNQPQVIDSGIEVFSRGCDSWCN